jgi:hypothetical protein
MSFFGWSKAFEEYEKIDIPARVRRTEITYWCSILAGIVMLIAGCVMTMRSFHLGMPGFLLILAGIVNIALVKIWAHIRLAAYQIILELRIRDKEAQKG